MSGIEITLNGKAETLRPSLGAAKKVNAMGGFMHVHSRLQAYDFDVFVMVTSAGLEKKASDVEAAVYKTGLPNLLADLTSFVNLLANGGKPITVPDGDDATGEE